MRWWTLSCIMTIYGGLSVFGQNTVDSLLMHIDLEEVEIVQKTGNHFVEQQGCALLVDLQKLEKLPKFMGTSDPLRYVQSLSGVTTNSETNAGLHLQGCDDYQTFVGINGAPVIYPNHLLGLYSTFNSPHFSLLKIRHDAHEASMPNRVGGLVDVQTKKMQPKRFGAEGSIGLIASDVTLTIPCGKKSGLWLSARASYPIFKLLGKLIKLDDNLELDYYFMDYNLTYAYHPTEKDDIVATGFYSRDKLGVDLQNQLNIKIVWQNLLGSVYWNHHTSAFNFRSTVSFSGFNTKFGLNTMFGDGKTLANMGTAEWKNKADWIVNDRMSISGGIDYVHYFFKPLDIQVDVDGVYICHPEDMQHADEISIYADWKHEITNWVNYSIGMRGVLYHAGKYTTGTPDPRITIEFIPSKDHHLYVHAGIYHQYFHKVALLDGGLPADFFIPANDRFPHESAHTASLKYQVDFLNREFSLSTDVYFKQLHHTVESTNNVFGLINTNFNYENNLLNGDGRNYGWNLLFQRNRGKLTGMISYSLAWSKRRLPELEGNDGYVYASNYDRRHDLNVVLNWQVAEKWNIGASFVCASGIPYTAVKEAYLLNKQMVCLYGKYNDAHLPTYHRLDLTCSYDIVKKNNHLFGINLSIYNVYNHHNAQFLVYRGALQPNNGSSLSTILPSISLYGRW